VRSDVRSSHRRGWSTIWKHPETKRAVVDTHGLGQNPRIAYAGLVFNAVREVKEFALSEEGRKL